MEIEFTPEELQALNEAMKFFENRAKWAFADENLQSALNKIRKEHIFRKGVANEI